MVPHLRFASYMGANRHLVGQRIFEIKLLPSSVQPQLQLNWTELALISSYTPGRRPPTAGPHPGQVQFWFLIKQNLTAIFQRTQNTWPPPPWKTTSQNMYMSLYPSFFTRKCLYHSPMFIGAFGISFTPGFNILYLKMLILNFHYLR